MVTATQGFSKLLVKNKTKTKKERDIFYNFFFFLSLLFGQLGLGED